MKSLRNLKNIFKKTKKFSFFTLLDINNKKFCMQYINLCYNEILATFNPLVFVKNKKIDRMQGGNMGKLKKFLILLVILCLFGSNLIVIELAHEDKESLNYNSEQPSSYS